MSARSHPPTLARLAERLVRDEALLGPGDRVLCACSGGPDSGALLHVLALLRPRFGHTLVAHGVDHGLRPEAAAELALAATLAESLGVPFAVTRVEVGPGGNLQARARAARYEALIHAAVEAGATLIATGHTADDRAETLLLRLLRGAGPRGLAVLPPRAPAPVADAGAPTMIRPLLQARRSDVLAHLERHQLPFARDPSNLDPRFSRVRVRRELLPLLEDLSPTIVAHLCALADMLGDQPALPTPPGEEGSLPGGEAAVADAGPGPGESELDPLRSLGRAQRLAVERARRLGRGSLRLRLRGGREVNVTFPGGRIVVNEAG